MKRDSGRHNHFSEENFKEMIKKKKVKVVKIEIAPLHVRRYFD